MLHSEMELMLTTQGEHLLGLQVLEYRQTKARGYPSDGLPRKVQETVGQKLSIETAEVCRLRLPQKHRRQMLELAETRARRRKIQMLFDRMAEVRKLRNVSSLYQSWEERTVMKLGIGLD